MVNEDDGRDARGPQAAVSEKMLRGPSRAKARPEVSGRMGNGGGVVGMAS